MMIAENVFMLGEFSPLTRPRINLTLQLIKSFK